MASPGAPGDGEIVGVPSFLARRVRRFVDGLCRVRGGSEVFRIDGGCLRQRVAENTSRTKMGHVHVRSLQRSRVSLLVRVKCSTMTVTSQIKRRDVGVACGCTRLFPSARGSVTSGLGGFEGTVWRYRRGV